MNPPEFQVRQCSRTQRRSKRLQLVVPVEVIAFEGESEAFREATRMLSVNANGGLLVLGGSVSHGQVLHLVNQRTAERRECPGGQRGPLPRRQIGRWRRVRWSSRKLLADIFSAHYSPSHVQ